MGALPDTNTLGGRCALYAAVPSYPMRGSGWRIGYKGLVGPQSVEKKDLIFRIFSSQSLLIAKHFAVLILYAEPGRDCFYLRPVPPAPSGCGPSESGSGGLSEPRIAQHLPSSD